MKSVFLLQLTTAIGIIVTYIYGIYLSFCAHVAIGLASILIPGSAFVVGICAYFGLDVPGGILELIQ